MPAIQYWFTGGALASALALIATMITLSYAWYRAAETEHQTALTKAQTEAEGRRLREVRERMALHLAEGMALIQVVQDTSKPAPKQEIAGWLQRTYEYLEQHVGVVFAARFLDDSGLLPLTVASLPADRRHLYTTIRNRTARLQQFLSEITVGHLRGPG